MDALANGRRIKCLTVVDDFSRECVDIAVDHGMGGEYVVRLLDQAAQFRGYWNTPLNLQTGCSGPTTSFPTPWTTCVSWPALLQPRRLQRYQYIRQPGRYSITSHSGIAVAWKRPPGQ